MKRAILACGCAALALAACTKSETKTTKAADGTTISTTTASDGSASATLTPPSRKAGLWEQSMTMAMPSGETHQMVQSVRMCLDEASEAKLKWWSTENRRGRSECSEQSISAKLGGGWKIHSVCDMGDGGKVVSDGEASGDFNSHYKVDVTSVTSGSAMAQSNGTHKISMDASWKGPCPAGMKPGDMEMPGGMKINLVDAASGTGATVNGMKPGQVPTQAEIAQMRAQAMEMAKRAKGAQ